MGLKVTLAKTDKAIVVKQRTLVFAEQTVDQVHRYQYLGWVMHQNGSFT